MTNNSPAPCGTRQPNQPKTMQLEIYNLLADNKPLPKGTRIKTTQGGIHTGANHELSDDLLKSANRMVNGYVPFWALSWSDLHADLIIPENADAKP